MSTTETIQAETVEEVICWVNAWANGQTHRARGASKDYMAGYERACSEIMDQLMPLGPDWLDTWREDQWRRLKPSA